MIDKKSRTRNSKKAKNQMDFLNVAAKIDNKAPRLNPENYLKSRRMLADSARLKVTDNENLELIKRLNLMNRLGGKVDRGMNGDKAYTKSCKSKLRTVVKEENRIITRDNKKLTKEINSTRSNYSTVEFLRDWKRIEANIERTAKYPLIWKDRFIPTVDDLRREARTRCFFDIEIAGSKENLGRMVFELYNDFTPVTCDNFIALCRGTENGLSYKGTPFHRIVPNYWCQGGDVTKFNGIGGTSIYGDKFENENFTLHHEGPGIISMYNNGKDGNNSKFNITFKSLSTINGKMVVFGKLISGLSNLYKIEELGCGSGKPVKTVIISKCGVIPVRG